MRTHSEAKMAAPTPASGARPASMGMSESLWRYLIIAFLALHGQVHLIGVVAAWRLDQASGVASGVASTPTFPAGLAAGSPVVLAVGAAWLVALAAFLAAAVGLALRQSWWRAMTVAAALVSLAVCLAWWNDAWIGVLIDVGILVGLAISTGFARPKGV